jgi:CHAT domain-containing protein
LLYAGTQGVLVTLWDVNDGSAAQAMGLFYEALKSKKNKAESLRQATLAIRRTNPHPFHWAPFVLVGKYL